MLRFDYSEKVKYFVCLLDILAATSAIAEYHSLNIFKMHLSLAVEFLQNSAKDEPSADLDLVRNKVFG